VGDGWAILQFFLYLYIYSRLCYYYHYLLINFVFCLFLSRVVSLLWEVKQLERNARLYNEEESQIVRNSAKLVSVLNEFIR